MSGYILCQTKKADKPLFCGEHQYQYLFTGGALLLICTTIFIWWMPLL